jgi:hypothetical protein
VVVVALLLAPVTVLALVAAALVDSEPARH